MKTEMKDAMDTLSALACVALIVMASGVGLAAQAAQETGSKAAQETGSKPARGNDVEAPPLIPLSVQVVVSKYQGEKRVSSMPYTLAVNANALRRGGAVSRLRMGAQIPVPMASPPVRDGKPVGPPGVGGMQYRDVGTSIDAWANSLEPNRFQLNISVEDTSVYPRDQGATGVPAVGELPVFRSFRSANELVLRDGQSAQFTAAADRVSGELIKVDVTLSVLK
jgi:hypothetical protein